MVGEFRNPRIEGTFAGERLKVWDVVWGSATGKAVIQNAYVDTSNVVIRSGDATLRADGRFSAGFPRRDGGEELNAVVRLEQWPLTDLRHAFKIDDYDVNGVLSGEFHVYGNYLTPYGFGSMTIAGGEAYGQTFESVTSSIHFEGIGVRLDTIQIAKGDGRGTGAAWVAWDGTYSFELEARGLPLESVDLAPDQVRPPVTGLVDFRAGGSGAFASPRYEVHTTLRDLFVADEGIGQVIGDITVTGRSLTLRLEAASPRLAVSGAGRVTLSEGYDADVTFNVASTSLDPYLRLIRPEISPYTTAVASGTVHVTGGLADLNRVKMDATVDRLDMGLFDYPLTNASPIRLSLSDRTVQISQMRLIGQDTALDVSGTASLEDQRIDLKLDGAANLGILQALVPNVRSPRPRLAFEHLRGSPRQPDLEWHDDHRGRAPPPLRRPARARERERHDRLRFARDPARHARGAARRGAGDDSAARSAWRAPDSAGWTSRWTVRTCGCGSPKACGRSWMPRWRYKARPMRASLAGQATVRDAVYSEPLTTSGSLFGLQSEGGASASDTPSVTTIPLSYDVRITAPSTLAGGEFHRCASWPARTSGCRAPSTGRRSSAAPTSSAARSASRGAATSSRAARSTSTIPRVSSRSSISTPKRACACLARPTSSAFASAAGRGSLTP